MVAHEPNGRRRSRPDPSYRILEQSGEAEIDSDAGLDPDLDLASSVHEHSIRIGERIRQMRRRNGLTAQEVARRAGVSAAYLSRLENDKISPTVATLSRLTQAMNESVSRLFANHASGPLVRRDMRREVHNRGVVDYIITPSDLSQLQVMETIVSPNQGSGRTPYTHNGEVECVLVLDGVLTIWLDGEPYRLRTGDAVTFPCQTPHRWENPGNSSARVLWIVTPSGY